MRVSLCRHLKTNGTQCQSPALEFSNYCFFHDRLHERHKNYRFSRTTERGLVPQHDVKLHALEDAESIQLAISIVVNELATGQLRPNIASTLLYGLQLASANLRNLPPKPAPQDLVRSVATTNDGLAIALPKAYAELEIASEAALPSPHTSPQLPHESVTNRAPAFATNTISNE